MRDCRRIERIMLIINAIWISNPNLRFNQLLYNLQREYKDGAYVKRAYMDTGGWGTIEVNYLDLFDVEDDDFEKFLNEYLKKYS